MQKNNQFPEKSSDQIEQNGQQHTAWDDLKNIPMAAKKIESDLKDDLLNIQDMLKHGKINQEQADKFTKEAEVARHPEMDDDTKKALDDDLANIQDMLEHGKITKEQADKYTKEVEDKAINKAYRKLGIQEAQKDTPESAKPKDAENFKHIDEKIINDIKEDISTKKIIIGSTTEEVKPEDKTKIPSNPEEAKLDAMLKAAAKKDAIAPEKKAQFKSEADMDAILQERQGELDGALTKEEEQSEVEPKKKIKKIIRRKIIRKVPTLAKEQIAEIDQQKALEEEQQKEAELQSQQEIEEQQELEKQQSEPTDAELNEELSRQAEQFLEENQDFEDRIINQTDDAIKKEETSKQTAKELKLDLPNLDEYKEYVEAINKINQELAKLDAQEKALPEPEEKQEDTQEEQPKEPKVQEDTQEQPETPELEEKKGILERVKDYISEINRINQEIAELDEGLDEGDALESNPETPETPEETSEASEEQLSEPSEESPETISEPEAPKEEDANSSEKISERSVDDPDSEDFDFNGWEKEIEDYFSFEEWNDGILEEIEQHQDLIGGVDGVKNMTSKEFISDSKAVSRWETWYNSLSDEGKSFVKGMADKIDSSDYRYKIKWGWGFRTWLAANG